MVLERENEEEHGEYNEAESERSDQNEKNQIFKLEVGRASTLFDLTQGH